MILKFWFFFVYRPINKIETALTCFMSRSFLDVDLYVQTPLMSAAMVLFFIGKQLLSLEKCHHYNESVHHTRIFLRFFIVLCL